MNTNFRIRHEFVETMPPQREEGVLYVSIPFATAVHNCFCGCGTKVVTPIKPAGWELTYDGDTVSLWPSVGSWGLPCRSHYIIRKDTVVWAGDMSQERIDQGRAHDRKMRDRYYETKAFEPTTPGAGNPARPVVQQVPVKSFGDGVKALLKAISEFGGPKRSK